MKIKNWKKYLHKYISENSLNDLEASEPKWVNPVLNNVGVNSLRLGGLHLKLEFCEKLKEIKL